MARLTLVIQPSDFANLFRPFVRTRGRLLTSLLVSLAITLTTTLGLSHYILQVSAHPTLNLLLILLIVLSILPTSLFLTITIGEFFFTKGWRTSTFVEKDELHEALSDHNLEFTVVLGVTFLAIAFSLNMLAGNFVRTYNEETFFFVKFRDPDPKVRRLILQELSSPFRYASWERPRIKELILSAIDDPDPEVQDAACFLVGFLKLPAGKDLLLQRLNDPKASPALRQCAAHRLASFGLNDEVRATLEKIVSTTQDNNSPVVIGALHGLAILNSSLSAPLVLERAKTALGTPVGQHALFALRTLPAPETRAWLRDTVTEPMEHPIQCQLFDLFKFVSEKKDANLLRRLFFRITSDEPCTPLVVQYLDETKENISYPDPIPVKILKAVANSSGAEQRAWYERVYHDTSLPYDVREMSGKIIKQLDN